MRRLQRLQRQVTLQLPHCPTHCLTSSSFSLSISPSLSLYVSPSSLLSLSLTLLFFMCVRRTHKIIARRRVQPIGVRVSTAALPLCVCMCMCICMCACACGVCVSASVCLCRTACRPSSFVIHQRGVRCGLRVAALVHAVPTIVLPPHLYPLTPLSPPSAVALPQENCENFVGNAGNATAAF